MHTHMTVTLRTSDSVELQDDGSTELREVWMFDGSPKASWPSLERGEPTYRSQTSTFHEAEETPRKNQGW